MVVRFVDNGGMVDHHYLRFFLFITYYLLYRKIHVYQIHAKMAGNVIVKEVHIHVVVLQDTLVKDVKVSLILARC